MAGAAPELPVDVAAAVTGAVVDVVAAVVVGVELGAVVDVVVDVEVDVVVDEVEVGSDVTEQQPLKLCAVPGATAVSGVVPVPFV